MRGRVALAVPAVALVACGFLASAIAKPAAFAIAPTRSCLVKKGAVFGSAADPAIAALPAAQRRQVLAGLLPPGTATLVLVVGKSNADAVALRNKIAAHMEFKPTDTNSRSGQNGNAAWFIESSGGRPPLALMTTVRGCLKAGASPTLPLLTRAAVSDCVGAHSGDVVDARTRHVLFPTIPASLSPYLLTTIVPGDDSGSSQGIVGFVLFGHTLQQSVTLRDRLVAALAGHPKGTTTGQGRGAAWLTVPTGRASTKQVTTARRIFADCLD
jgi:hypothetical protein